MIRSIARVVVPVGMVVLASLANAQQGMPNPTHGAKPAHDDDIHLSQQYAGQDHEVGGRDARVKVQLPSDEGRSLLCRDSESCGGHFLCFVFKR